MKDIAGVFFIILYCSISTLSAQGTNARTYGIEIGVLSPGPNNAITDVGGVQVGHRTMIEGKDIRTGVTAILPHPGNIFQQKVPAAVYVGNGFGKLTGTTQINELGMKKMVVIPIDERNIDFRSFQFFSN